MINIPGFLGHYLSSRSLRPTNVKTVMYQINSELKLLSNQLFFGDVNSDGDFDFESRFDYKLPGVSSLFKSLNIKSVYKYTIDPAFDRAVIWCDKGIYIISTIDGSLYQNFVLDPSINVTDIMDIGQSSGGGNIIMILTRGNFYIELNHQTGVIQKNVLISSTTPQEMFFDYQFLGGIFFRYSDNTWEYYANTGVSITKDIAKSAFLSSVTSNMVRLKNFEGSIYSFGSDNLFFDITNSKIIGVDGTLLKKSSSFNEVVVSNNDIFYYDNDYYLYGIVSGIFYRYVKGIIDNTFTNPTISITSKTIIAYDNGTGNIYVYNINGYNGNNLKLFGMDSSHNILTYKTDNFGVLILSTGYSPIMLKDNQGFSIEILNVDGSVTTDVLSNQKHIVPLGVFNRLVANDMNTKNTNAYLIGYLVDYED